MRALIAQYAARGILVDTNVLLLYLVGLLDVSLIEKFKRTQSRGCSQSDFVLVRNLLACFRRIVTTPQILAEVSNLSMQMSESLLARYFACAVRVLQGAHEEFVGKDAIVVSSLLPLLPRVGYTDLTIIEAARKCGYLVLTDDFKAAGYLRASHCAVVNLNQVRGQFWLADSPPPG